MARALSREMNADPRFSDIRWNRLEEAVRDLPGTAHPVAEA
jgi:hypothetical protein